MNKQIDDLQKIVHRTVERANEILKTYKGKKVIIPQGKYKGRVGVTEYPHVSIGGDLVAMMRPINIGNHGSELLWDHVDARTYWPLKDARMTNPTQVKETT